MRAMKDSGVEWIGEIPEGWSICRLKDYASIQNGQDHKAGDRPGFCVNLQAVIG